jgi:hypothetical protein
VRKTIAVFRWGDIIVILALLAGCAFSIPLLSSNTPQIVDIYKDNNLVATYPLASDNIVSIEGINDTMTIAIRDAGVAVIGVHCPHRLCMQSGRITHQGQQIVCAPNHILITISGNPSAGEVPDGIAR